MTVRQLQPLDFEQVIQLAESWKSPQFDWPKLKLRSELDENTALGVFQGQSLIAFVVMADRSVAWEITCLATHKAAVRSGQMGVLLRWILDHYRDRPEIWLEVHAKNLAARNLYIKMGFQEVGTRPNYYADGEPAILMTYKIF